nr:hypothetical protein [Sphingobium sp. CFD-2]
MVVPFDLEAVSQRFNNQVVNLLVEAEFGQQCPKLLLKGFLAYEFFRAFPPEAGAVVVNVFALLDLRRERAPAMAAADQTSEGELTDATTGLGITRLHVAPIKNILHTMPQILRD